MFDIDTAHRVPSRNNNGQPKPIVCRFVRRLAKESIMNHRKDACKLNLASVGLPEDASLSAVRIFDPLFTYGKMPHLELSRSRILVICSTWEMETKAKYIS